MVQDSNRSDVIKLNNDVETYKKMVKSYQR